MHKHGNPFVLLWVTLSLLLSASAFAGSPAGKNNILSSKLRFSGYLKFLQTTTFLDGIDNIVTNNLIHHRLNFHYYPIADLQIALEARNRIFFGEVVKLTNAASSLGLLPRYSKQIENDDLYPLTLLVLDREALVWQIMLDRAYLRFSRNKFELTAGRQRINWGMTLVWNPNDIFNAYSFYDFDYEERPGSDALRLVCYPNTTSSLELAGKIAYRKADIVAAALYRFNKKRYDFQFFSGVHQTDWVAGAGWAGHIGNAGFKGELSYFHPYEKLSSPEGVFLGTFSFDYSFKNNLYLNGSFLYSTAGSMHTDSLLQVFDVSVKNLSPYRYNILSQIMYPFTPILNGALAVQYSPGDDHALILHPVLTYNIRENWDLDLVAQILLSGASGRYTDVAELLFFRIRWSY
ncbi:MAG: hypothetical protein KatS3mg031_0874 [Chitinophagales bacterium]|nr:MAG: hypothetical protein KatS3mg031_0874 [Chitinophagales bacterium]